MTTCLNRWLPLMMMVVLSGGCATSGDFERDRDAPKAMTKVDADAVRMEVTADKTEGPATGKSKPLEAAEKFKLYPGTGVFVKPVPTPLPDNGIAGDDVALNFDGADLREVVKIVLVDIMRENYIIDPRVQGVVNIHSSGPIKRSSLLPTLEAVLRMNGASLVRETDGVYRVTPFATAIKGELTPQVGGMNKPLPQGYSVQIVPLRFIAAREMVKILEPFTPEGGIVRVDDTRNLLFLGGNSPELRHLMETIDLFDVDWISGMSVALFTLKSVDVKTASAEIDKLFGDKQGPLAGILRIIPVERLNALLVITPQPAYLEQARLWVERLDRSGGSSGGARLYVYQVQNGRAEKMAALLSEAFSSKKSPAAAPPPALAPGLAPAQIASPPAIGAPAAAATKGGAAESLPLSESGSARIIADKDNNALLIMASPAEYEVIENAVRKLDVVPRQVLIEVTIAEITLSDEFTFGLEWYFNSGAKGNGVLNTGNSSSIGPLTPGFSYTWLSPAGSVRAVLNALAANSKLNIISSPHLMVSDNQTAKIQVGDRVPTVSQTQSLGTAVTTTTGTTTGVISSVQYLDTGILLTVKPHINAGGLITMEINQEVSNASKTVSSGIDSPTFSQRSVQSTVTVQAGETMVLGGLISDSKSNGSSGVPLLSEVPVLGALFGAQNIKKDRTELIMMITPKLVSNSLQAREITEEFRKRLGGLSTQR